MSGETLELLLVEDNPGDARLIEEMLSDAETLLERVDLAASSGLRIHNEATLAAGIDRLESGGIDVVLLDLGLPDSTGLETLASVVDAAELVPVIVLTGLQDERVGIQAIKGGAQDYLVKDEVSSDLLVRSIHHAIERNRQERDRRRRANQLEALNRLTRELMDPGSPTAVSEHVVTAAAERLDLTVMAVALYDDEAAALRATATTEQANDLLDLDDLLASDGGAGWRAFAENGDPVTLGCETIDDPLTELALFPMARHGVLVVGETTAHGISDADLDFLGTVASNVEAALDRVERDREREERERLLEEQNRTLERLNRINDIIRSISRALVRVSTREEIESVACEQLAGAGPYGLAWIGEHDHASGEVAVREQAGGDRNPVDEAGQGIAALAGVGSPVALAVEERESQVVNDVLEDGQFESWQRAALDRGYHAMVSIPLVYEDAMYGVLSVYAEQTGVFGDLERAVLGELADTIAYAINAAESKKALVGQEVTRLEFDVSDTEIPFVELAAELDCSIDAENFVSRSDGGVRRFLSVRGATADEVLDAAGRLTAGEFALVSEYEGEEETVCLFRTGLTDDSAETTMIEHGARPQEFSAGNGEATVIAELGGDAAVREFVEVFRDRYPGASLVAQRTHQRSSPSVAEQRASATAALTDRQLEAIRTAYFSGFFDRPRKHTGTEIADAMGISQPTFSHHLREAHRKLCEALFDRELDATSGEDGD